MIVGHGAIASVLKDRDDRLYFASGVPDSREARDVEFDREADLLMAQDFSRHLVYFSTLSVFTADTPYTRHKRAMELLVTEWPCYTIIRLGNINWATNRCQLIPYLRERISNNEEFSIYDEYRYILSKGEFLYWIDHIPSWNCEMNITGRLVKVPDLVYEMRKEIHNAQAIS